MAEEVGIPQPDGEVAYVEVGTEAPLTWNGKVIGKIRVNAEGGVDGDIDTALLTEEEKNLVFGQLNVHNMSVEHHNIFDTEE